MLRNFGQALWALLMLVAVAQAQFNFFEHMFGANQQQQHQQQASQNVPSDSGRYQNSWRQGEFHNSEIGWEVFLHGVNSLLILGIPSQLNAATICVPGHSPASLSLIIAHARIPMLKKRLSLEKGALSVCPRADSRLARRHERSSLPGRGSCDQFASMKAFMHYT